MDFYQSLFTNDQLDMQVQFKIIGELEFLLTDLEREVCEGPFTLDALYTALKGLQTGKAPGSMVFQLSFISVSGMILVIRFSRF